MLPTKAIAATCRSHVVSEPVFLKPARYQHRVRRLSQPTARLSARQRPPAGPRRERASRQPQPPASPTGAVAAVVLALPGAVPPTPVLPCVEPAPVLPTAPVVEAVAPSEVVVPVVVPAVVSVVVPLDASTVG